MSRFPGPMERAFREHESEELLKRVLAIDVSYGDCREEECRVMSGALPARPAEFTSLPSNPDPRDWSKPSLAVVASDGKGNGLVLFYVGAHIQQWIEDMGSTLKNLGLEHAPCGISVWEGTTETTRSYDGEYDSWLEGDFREPTDDEWLNINEGTCPWDDGSAALLDDGVNTDGTATL